MVIFPNCKINLGLQVLEKRTDGFHNLQTVFYPVPLYDVLEIIPSADSTFSTTGINIEGDKTDNLCSKAALLLQKKFPDLPSFQMHLHKNIPSGAGLGGGSADGSFTLKLLNQLFHLNLSEKELISLSLQLGSDCPFFILNKACIAEGRGELLRPIQLDLSEYYFVLVHPGIHINTGWAFSQLKPSGQQGTIESIIQLPVHNWKNTLHNDFEGPAFAKYPVLATIKQQLYDAGAVYASMSGSGSSLYGIFKRGLEIDMTTFKDFRVDVLLQGAV